MKYLFGLIGLLSILSNNTDPVPDIRPPGTIKVAYNLFADVQEITNIDYKEYLSYLKRMWGKSSEVYISALPDTTVWRIEGQYNEPYVETYFNHPAYNSYPLVGVSLEQANQYASWRSDRVTEMLLLNDGTIKQITDLTKENYFTIEKYIAGGQDWIIEHKSIFVARYIIPSEAEWEFIARGTVSNEYGIDSLNRKTKKHLKRTKGNYFKVKRDPFVDSEDNSTNVTPSSTGPKNTYGLRNIIGNVAEITSTNTVKGGSWNHYLEESKISKSIKYEGPKHWIGFRNICRLEKVEVD